MRPVNFYYPLKGIIDTPGFNDTEGLEQDACNLASIQKMLDSHEALQSLEEGGLKLFPNVIMILVKATDKRFEGPNSSLSKSLMSVQGMGIVDLRKNNVMVVLTNVMAFGNAKYPQKWRAQLKNKSRKIKNLGKSILVKTKLC